ncbi:MAG: hypothetical protein HHJ16_03380 [Polaromonas sp.]|uniref:hypothetical protein n=1 Tax=Polaromonas sp. TaxID=1869339 RepID=UPI0017F540D4|nr:hypothetical protein [Polaromonas sp.]NMM09294.1 hypothetical protein [Polaromonas sp.]
MKPTIIAWKMVDRSVRLVVLILPLNARIFGSDPPKKLGICEEAPSLGKAALGRLAG